VTDDTEKDDKSMRITMRVQNSGTNDATVLQKE
jgi:hypothetical protein